MHPSTWNSATCGGVRAHVPQLHASTFSRLQGITDLVVMHLCEHQLVVTH
jgi:hypothetical protein